VAAGLLAASAGRAVVATGLRRATAASDAAAPSAASWPRDASSASQT